VSGDDAEAAAETLKSRQCGPDAVAFLRHVLRTDKFASATRVWARRARCWKRAGSFHLKPRRPGSSASRRRPTAPTGAREHKSYHGAARRMARTKETGSPARQMAGACLHILDRNRSGGAVGVKRRDTQATRRQARGARRVGVVSRRIDHDRAEIAARPVQSIAACGARGAVACRSAVVGLPLGKRGDVGAVR
jgi:hypothetical protein